MSAFTELADQCDARGFRIGIVASEKIARTKRDEPYRHLTSITLMRSASAPIDLVPITGDDVEAAALRALAVLA